MISTPPDESLPVPDPVDRDGARDDEREQRDALGAVAGRREVGRQGAGEHQPRAVGERGAAVARRIQPRLRRVTRARARELAAARIEALGRKIAELEEAREALRRLAGECGSGSPGPCPILTSFGV